MVPLATEYIFVSATSRRNAPSQKRVPTSIFNDPLRSRFDRCRVGQQEETAMSRNKAFVALAVTTALGVLSAAPAVAKDDDSDRRGERGGSVRPCSLDGGNPVHHPEI